jgi:hypothetical protein
MSLTVKEEEEGRREGMDQGSGDFPKESTKLLEHSTSSSTTFSRYFKVSPSFLMDLEFE